MAKRVDSPFWGCRSVSASPIGDTEGGDRNGGHQDTARLGLTRPWRNRLNLMPDHDPRE